MHREIHTRAAGWVLNGVSKPQTGAAALVVILVTVGKGALNTKVSTDRGFNGAEEQGERQAVGVSGSTFPL